MNTWTAVEGMVYLIACALHGKSPKDEILSKLDYPSIYTLSVNHSLSALCWYALSAHDEYVPEELCKTWATDLTESIRRNALHDLERQQFEAFCDQNAIRYLPLKGILLQNDYPAPGTREMADNDILYDTAYGQQVEAYFKARGYRAESYLNHEIYTKAPCYNFELHRTLIHEFPHTPWRAYYENTFDRLLSEKERPCAMRFTDDDFYIFVMVHAYKHYYFSGTGIRNLVDCYLCRHRHKLNRAYLDRAFKMLEITAFEREAVLLSDVLFSDPDTVQTAIHALSDSERKALDFYISSGAYGSSENADECRMRNYARGEEHFSLKTKLGYLYRRIFMDREWMVYWCRYNAPFFLRHPRLLCLAPFWRMVTKGGNHKRELKKLMNK